jgi:transposase-like protein
MAGGTIGTAAAKRRWPRETKRRIVAESREPDARVGEVAARHGLSASLLSVWRGLIDEAPGATPSAASFIPVRMIDAAMPAASHRPATAADANEGRCLQIMLPDGTRLYISHAAQLPLLHDVLGMLRQ